VSEFDKSILFIEKWSLRTMASIFVGNRAELADGSRIMVEWAGREVCVFGHGSRFHAFENKCLHQGGPVAEGVVLGKVECVLDDQKRALGERFSETETHLVCPWHGWEYDLETGRSVTAPRSGLRRFDVRVDGHYVYLEVPDDEA
jgi:nitrite reductase/ring-hydroxylating ferredoxin subunit